MAIYVAVVESEGPGTVQPIITSRDPDLIRLVRQEIDRRLGGNEEQREQRGPEGERE